MKPIKLEIEGLNSFETKQTLDFTNLGDGVFGIFGKTGSGKSTILDAITLALYGSVERSKQNIDFINTKCKKAIVSLEFKIFTSGKNRTFVVSRTFSAKKSGVESTATLFEKVSGELETIAEGASKVTEKIYKYVGLGAEEFSKCIALPQGEFSAFLKANPAKRTEIMSNIFDLSKYGDKLTQSVKRKYNEFDKNVTALSAIKQHVEYATDELLSQAKLSLDGYSGEYSETSEKLRKLSLEYANLTKIAEKKAKLDEILDKLDKLLKEKDDIEKLKVEAAKNASANEIKSDYDKLKVATGDEKELSDKIAILNEGKLCAQSELDVASAEYNEFQRTYQDKLLALNSKLARLKELDGLVEELKTYEAEEEKINKEILEKKSELSGSQEELNYLLSSLTKISEDIEKIDEFIDTNKPDVDLSYALEQTKGIESEIILIDDFNKKIEALVDQINADLESVKSEYASAIKQEKEFVAKREQIQNSIEVAFEESESSNFSKLRSCDKQLSGMVEVEAKVDATNDVIDKLHADTENRMAAVSLLDDEISKEQVHLTESETEISKKEAELAKAREDRESYLGDNVISLISGNLKIGDYCPVCNSRVVQKNYDEKVDLSAIDGTIKMMNNELRSMRFDRDKIFANLVSLKSRYEFEKNQIEINKSELKKLTESRAAFYQKYVDINDNSKENFEKLKGLLSKTAESLEELIELQAEIRDAEQRVMINKIQAGTKVTAYQNQLESLLDIIYDLQKKRAEREFAIMNLSEKYESLKEFKRQIAEGKSVELIIDSKKEERNALKVQQADLNRQKEDAERKIHQLSTAIDVLNEKLDGNSKLINSVKSKIVLGGVPEGVSIEDEKLETDKAIQKLQYDFEVVEQRQITARENLSRTENEYNVKSSILSSKRIEITQLESKITKCMQDAGFASDEELEANFVESFTLKAKQEKINNFESELKVTQIQKDELMAEVSENVDEDRLSSIKEEIDTCEAKVKVLSENVGSARANYDRIKADNEKNHEISAELEGQTHNLDLAKELLSLLKGKALAEYVAEEFLNEITESANQKLGLLLDGRYTLKFAGKEFMVEDNFSDAEMRPASTLSGGETFLVSLSLALSISESISMLSERSMDFFFLDEGFGTLDSELCEAVVSALYKLESQNLKIGLISHVSELEDQIKNKVIVTKGQGGTKIKIEHSL